MPLNPLPLPVLPLISSFFSLVATGMSSLSPSLFLFCYVYSFALCFSISHISDKTIFVFLYLTYFTKHNIVQVHPCCCRCQNFILFYGWDMCVYTHTHTHTYVYTYLSMKGHLVGLHILAIVNSATVNIGLHVFFKLVFTFFWIYVYLEVKLLDHNGNSIFSFLRKFYSRSHSGCTSSQ